MQEPQRQTANRSCHEKQQQRFNLLRFVIKVTCSSQMWMVLDDCHGHHGHRHVCRLHVIEIKPASYRTSNGSLRIVPREPMWATLHGASEFTRLSLAGGRFKCLQSGEFWKPEITGVFLVRTLLVPLLYLLSQEILLKWCERPQVLPRFWIGPSRCRPRTKVFHDIGTLKKISALFGLSDWINQRLKQKAFWKPVELVVPEQVT